MGSGHVSRRTVVDSDTDTESDSETDSVCRHSNNFRGGTHGNVKWFFFGSTYSVFETEKVVCETDRRETLQIRAS